MSQLHPVHKSEQKHCSWERETGLPNQKEKAHGFSGQRVWGDRRVDWVLGSETLYSAAAPGGRMLRFRAMKYTWLFEDERIEAKNTCCLREKEKQTEKE